MRGADVTSLTRHMKRNDDERDGLRSRLVELEALLGDRAGELTSTKAALDAFEVRYRHKVGTLHEQLEKLEMAIAEAELGEISKRLQANPGNVRAADLIERLAETGEPVTD